LYDALQRRGLQARMLLQVHDELVLEVPDGELAVVAPLVKAEMEDAYELAAPLKVDMEAGPNWYELYKVEA
ncbi:MAG TPA: DNA polymerase, partial [Anaerolineae bacterium]